MKQKLLILLIAISLISIGCNNKETEQVETSPEKTEVITSTTEAETNKVTDTAQQKSIPLEKQETEKKQTISESKTESVKKSDYPLITFIELGSVNCIPCKKMQPVMESLEKKYGEQLKVIFYDVWKKEYKSKSEEYGIKLIPTQVFLDKNGKEVHRHEGFYPEEEIDKFLQSKGLKILSGKK